MVDSNRPRRARACLAQAAVGCCAPVQVPGQVVGEGDGSKVLAGASSYGQEVYGAASGARQGRGQRSDVRSRQ